MRTFLILRAPVLAAALAVPLAQSALAQQTQQEEQQATASGSAATAPYYGDNGAPYSNDTLMSPPVGE